MAKAREPRAFVNVRNVGFAKIETMDDEATTYAPALLTRGIKSISSESSSEVKVAYADGLEIETGRNNGTRSMSLVMHEFPTEVSALLFNQEPDENGVVAEKRNDTNSEVATWFVHERKDGTYKLYIFPRVAFNEPNLEAQQEEDDYEWTEETSEGMAMYRLNDEIRRFVYDSKTATGKVEDVLKLVFGDVYDIAEIYKSIEKKDLDPGV